MEFYRMEQKCQLLFGVIKMKKNRVRNIIIHVDDNADLLSLSSAINLIVNIFLLDKHFINTG